MENRARRAVTGGHAALAARRHTRAVLAAAMIALAAVIAIALWLVLRGDGEKDGGSRS
jgi:hypothetical protein